MLTRIALLALPALSPPGELLDRNPPGITPSVYISEHVRLEADFRAPDLLENLGIAIEEALPIYEAETGLEFPEGERFEIRLFAEIEPYRRAISRVGVSAFESAGAVTAWSNQKSYIVVQPRAEPRFLEAVQDLPEMTLQLVLHEVAHQFAWKADMFPPMYMPSWYVEGMAEYLAQLAMTRDRPGRLRHTMRLADAHNQMAIDVASGSHIPLDDLFALGFESPGAANNASRLYYQSRSVFAFLSSGRVPRWLHAFRRFSEQVEQRERPDRSTSRIDEIARIDAMWRETIDDLDRLEDDWKRSTLRQAPVGDWFERYRSSQWIDDELVTATVSWNNTSLVLNNELVPRNHFRISCDLSILAVGRGQADIVLVHRSEPQEFLKLAIGAEGHMTLIEYRDEGWEELRVLDIPPFRGDERWWHLEIDVEGHDVRAVLDSEGLEEPHVLSAVVPEEFSLEGGNWGLGTSKSAARFRNIRIE